LYLDKISDDWLICLYREGNQVAIDLLYERYSTFLYGFIHKLIRKENFNCEYKELFQELIVVFIRCLERYDEDNGCFYYFVKTSAERKLYDILNKIRESRKIISLDGYFYDDGTESLVDYVKEENNEFYFETDLYKNLNERLDVVDMRIIDLKVEGYNYQEIADKLNVSKQAIYRKVVLIKNIIKDIIEKID